MFVRITPVSVPCGLIRQLYRVQHYVRTYLTCLCPMWLNTSTLSCSTLCSYVSHLSLSRVSYYVNFIVFNIMFVHISPVSVPCGLIRQLYRVQHYVRTYLTCLCPVCLITSTLSCSTLCSYISHLSLSRVSYYVNFIVFNIMFVHISPVSVPCVLLRQLYRVQHYVRTYLTCLCPMWLNTSTLSCSASCSYVSHLSLSHVA